jgi:RNA polymerase sigma factor (sigma-70 family)
MTSSTNMDNGFRPGSDAELVRAIRAGSVEAWHEFLHRYSGLVYRVVERHLPCEDEDEVRSVHVEVLRRLYNGDLSKHDSIGRLSTWLMLYARRRALDHLRSKHGRKREPAGYARLSRLERDVFRLFYVERMGLEVVVHTLRWMGYRLSPDDIVDSIQQIERLVAPRYLRRLDDEHAAWCCGGSARLLRYLVDRQVEYERTLSSATPERELIERETREMADRVRECVVKLPPIDRQIIELRFGGRLQASEIAEKLGLEGPRKAYTMIERAIRRLRMAISSQ